MGCRRRACMCHNCGTRQCLADTLAAMSLRRGFSLNMHILKLKYNQHPGACTGLVTRPLHVALHAEHAHFAFCTDACFSNPCCDQHAEQASPCLYLLTGKAVLPPITAASFLLFLNVVWVEPSSTRVIFGAIVFTNHSSAFYPCSCA